MNHLGFAPIALPDSPLHVLAVGDELIHAGALERNPTGADNWRAGPLPRASSLDRIHSCAIRRTEVPQVSHGRVAIADVPRAGMRKHAFRRTGLAADHQIVVAKIERSSAMGIRGSSDR